MFAAPKAVNDAYPQSPDGVTDIPAFEGILNNDTVPCEGNVKVTAVAPLPKYGTVSLDPKDGSFKYTAGDVQQRDSFGYKIDCNGQVSQAIVTLPPPPGNLLTCYHPSFG